MLHEHNVPLSQKHWEIFYLLIEKSQIDPWTLDFRGENPWHTFCQTCQSSVNLPWMSIAHEFLPILNDQDHFGRTALFLMSSNSKADLDIFQWHLSNGADLSISANGHNPRLKGLTCLHAAIASLQPRHQKCRFGPLDSNYAEILGCRFGTRKNKRPIYDEDDRVTQKRRIQLLIQNGSDLFAVSESYGTPTDIARFTRNFGLWIDCLKSCGISPKQLLARDKKIERSKKFLVTKRLVYEQKLEQRKVRQHFDGIFEVLDDFQSLEEANGTEPREYTVLPIPLLHLNMSSYKVALRMLRNAYSRAIYVEKDHQIFDGQQIFRNSEIFEGLYHANFFLGNCHYYDGPIETPVYNKLDRYLETIAAIVSEDIRLEEPKRKLNHRYLAFFKAIAMFHLDNAFRFPPWGCDWRYENDLNEVYVNIPGSWPQFS
jgi:hypothetical protein